MANTVLVFLGTTVVSVGTDLSFPIIVYLGEKPSNPDKLASLSSKFLKFIKNPPSSTSDPLTVTFAYY